MEDKLGYIARIFILKNKTKQKTELEAGEKAQRLRVGAALAEDLG